MRYYIIAGEASGDLHASNLIRGLRAEDPEADIRGWGGDLMRRSGDRPALQRYGYHGISDRIEESR